MMRGVRWYLVGSVILGALGVLGVLAGCSGGFFGAEREPWRHEAEVECLASGAVRESANVARINAISGPGMCGADFPLKVAMLAEGSVLGYSDDLRPPGAIPNGAQQPRWPTSPRADTGGAVNGPVSLNPPGRVDAPNAGPETHDYRKPYGAPPPSSSPSPRAGSMRDPPPGSVDMSPVPYERRRVIDTQLTATPRGPPLSASRGAVRAEPLPDVGRMPSAASDMSRSRDPQAPPPALGPSRGPGATGSLAMPVGVNPPATLACPMVSELDRWIANSVQPAAMRWFGAPVAEIKQISAYSCRGMNGNPRARISEHAFGNALDIAAFTLADGRKITVKNGWHGLPEEQGFLRDVQAAACDQFTTVLAPGSNVYHYDHIHVDLMRRRDGHRACNPQAVSGEEVAARAGGPRYAARRPGEYTGSVEQRRAAPARKRWRNPDEERRQRVLPLAEPGNDGEGED